MLLQVLSLLPPLPPLLLLLAHLMPPPIAPANQQAQWPAHLPYIHANQGVNLQRVRTSRDIGLHIPKACSGVREVAACRNARVGVHSCGYATLENACGVC